MEALKLLETFEFVEPGDFARSLIAKADRERIFPLSDLTRGPGETCAWCNKVALPGRRKKYCRAACQESAYMYCYPQDPRSKAWILINRQACACTYCGISHEEWVAEKIAKRREHNERCIENWEKASERYKNTYPRPTPEVTYYQIGYNSGDRLHVDHIQPIHQGGRGVGFENVQVLCVQCHRQKTVKERGGR